MANELNYFGKILETGLTVTAKVYDSSGVQVGADINCTEAGALAIYIGDMPTATVGQYGVRFFDGAVLLGQGFINWDGTKEIDFNLDATVSSRLDSAAYVEADNASIAAIKAKTDTLVNTDLTGIALSSEISALNDFDPTLDTVARVTLVDTTTANTDMRGTDGANTIAPDNTSITSILADTNELQLNQGNFATATGFATPTDVTDSETNIITEVNGNESKIDIIDFNVDAIKLKTDTLVNTDLTGIALSSEISALNDVTPAEVRAAFNEAEFKDKNTELEFHTWLNTYANKDGYKANVSQLSDILEDTSSTIPSLISNISPKVIDEVIGTVEELQYIVSEVEDLQNINSNIEEDGSL